jgi:MFS transporter, PPP family, 3-phenylpropionic acid transporter
VIEESEGLNYSKFRIMASAAYALTNLILGYVIKFYGINISFVIYEVIIFLALSFVLTMKYEGKKSLQKIELKDVGIILRGKGLRILFFTVFLMNAAFIGGVNFMNELILFTKGDVAKLGMNWFVTCIFEVGTFFAVVKLMKKFGVVSVYLFSTVIYGVKFLLNFIIRDANLIIIMQFLEGIAFTLFITSSMEYLNRNTESKVRATAMSIYAAAGGLGAFSASLFGGMLLNQINPSELYGIFGLLCFAAFIFGLALRPKGAKLQGIPDLVELE